MAFTDRQASSRSHDPDSVVTDPAVKAPNELTHAAGGVSGIESIDNEKSPSRPALEVVTSIV